MMSNSKRICAAAVLGLSAAAWAAYRSRKYLIAPGYPPLQWLVWPGGLLRAGTAAVFSITVPHDGSPFRRPLRVAAKRCTLHGARQQPRGGPGPHRAGCGLYPLGQG